MTLLRFAWIDGGIIVAFAVYRTPCAFYSLACVGAREFAWKIPIKKGPEPWRRKVSQH